MNNRKFDTHNTHGHTQTQIHTRRCFTLKDLLFKEIIWFLPFVQNIQAAINELKNIFGHFFNYLIKIYENAHSFTIRMASPTDFPKDFPVLLTTFKLCDFKGIVSDCNDRLQNFHLTMLKIGRGERG